MPTYDVDTDQLGTVMIEYAPSGEILRTINVPSGLGNGPDFVTDIAVSSDGTRLWAIDYEPRLWEVDINTGAILSNEIVTGPWLGSSVALVYLDSGLLLTLEPDLLTLEDNLVTIDPTTHVSSILAADVLPPDYSLSGDVVPFGDDRFLLTVNDGGSLSYLYQIDIEGSVVTGTFRGETPTVWGAAFSGGTLYLAGAEGDLFRVNEIPSTASLAPLDITVVASLSDSGITNFVDDPAGFWGAASSGDSGFVCVDDHDGAPRGELAATGSASASTLGSVAGLLLVLGASLFAARRFRADGTRAI